MVTAASGHVVTHGSSSQGLTTPSDLSAAKLRSTTAVRNSLIVIATIAVIWAMQWLKVFLIPLAVSMCAAFWLMPMVDALERIRLPRAIGAATVLGVLIFSIGGTGYSLRADARSFLDSLSSATQHARMGFEAATHDPNGWLHHLHAAVTDRTLPASGGKSNTAVAAAGTPDEIQISLVRSSTTVASVAADMGVLIFLIYLLLASGDLFKRKLLIVISGHLSRRRVTVEILDEIAVQFQRYLAVLATTNVAIGLLTWAAFAALGVEHAAVWGVAAGILHVVPYLGPAIIAVAAFLVTSVQFDSLSQALVVAAIFLAISTLIGILLTTWLASRASNMNSVAVFSGLMFWGWLWGIPGLLLGTPLMMAIKVMADRIDCLNWVGTFLGGAPKVERNHKEPLSRTSPLGETAKGLTEVAAEGEAPFVAPEVARETTVLARTDARRSGKDITFDEQPTDVHLPELPARA